MIISSYKYSKMPKKSVKKPVKISKLTNLFLGIALGTLIGYYGGTPNLIIAGVAIVVIILLAIIYRNER